MNLDVPEEKSLLNLTLKQASKIVWWLKSGFIL